MAVQGSLKTITIPELFSLLHQLRKTGILTLVAESDERSFLFYRGDLVYAMARDGTRKMGSYLVRLGLITADELSNFLARPSTGDLYFGQKLLEAGKLQRQDIQAAVEAQILDILCEALTWHSGAFQFDDGELPFSIPDGSPIATQTVVFEAARRADERNWVKSLLPELQSILGRVETVQPDVVAPSNSHVLSLVDGIRTIEEILFTSDESERATAMALRDMLDRGILRELSAISRKGNITQAAQDLRSLPVSPNVPGKLFAIFNGDGQKVPRLADVLASDPMLATKVLRIASQKKPDIPRQDLGLRQIANQLGAFELRSILLPEAIRGLFFSRPAVFWKESWEHSIFCAQASQRIAQLIDYPYPEEAYLAGLLHNIGLFILHHHDADRYRRLVAESVDGDIDIEMLEEHAFGVSHSKLGGLQAENWAFPRTISLTIRGHNQVDATSGNPVLNMVTVACGLAEESGFKVGFVPAMSQKVKCALKRLNVNYKKVSSLVSSVPRAVVAPITQ